MKWAWYVKNGDPHWDDDKLWTAMGHLYKGVCGSVKNHLSIC